MKVEIDIQKKPRTKKTEKIKVTNPNIVYKLKEVQAIKNAIQEHLIFIGLDKCNNLRAISFLGIGTSSNIQIDSKDIIRTALINACDKVILVHNHPANSINPSISDKHITNVSKKLLKIFNIELVDHIIVTENAYSSMKEIGAIDKDYSDNKIEFIEKSILIEENKMLKEKINISKNKIKDIER